MKCHIVGFSSSSRLELAHCVEMDRWNNAIFYEYSSWHAPMLSTTLLLLLVHQCKASIKFVRLHCSGVALSAFSPSAVWLFVIVLLFASPSNSWVIKICIFLPVLCTDKILVHSLPVTATDVEYFIGIGIRKKQLVVWLSIWQSLWGCLSRDYASTTKHAGHERKLQCFISMNWCRNIHVPHKK